VAPAVGCALGFVLAACATSSGGGAGDAGSPQAGTSNRTDGSAATAPRPRPSTPASPTPARAGGPAGSSARRRRVRIPPTSTRCYAPKPPSQPVQLSRARAYVSANHQFELHVAERSRFPATCARTSRSSPRGAWRPLQRAGPARPLKSLCRAATGSSISTWAPESRASSSALCRECRRRLDASFRACARDQSVLARAIPPGTGGELPQAISGRGKSRS
jgi:hypothetical protein